MPELTDVGIALDRSVDQSAALFLHSANIDGEREIAVNADQTSHRTREQIAEHTDDENGQSAG